MSCPQASLLPVSPTEAADIRRRFALLVGDAAPSDDPATLTARWTQLHARWCRSEPPVVWSPASVPPVADPYEPPPLAWAGQPEALSLGCQTSPIRPDLLALHWDAPDTLACDDNSPTPIPSPPGSPRAHLTTYPTLPLPPRYLPVLLRQPRLQCEGSSQPRPRDLEPGPSVCRKRAGVRLMAQPPAFGKPPDAAAKRPCLLLGGLEEDWLGQELSWASEEELFTQNAAL